MVDGWRLVVAPGPPADARFSWDFWLRAQDVQPDSHDVQVDMACGPDGDSHSYWVRGDLPLSDADRVIIVDGPYDPRRRKNNTVLGQCADGSGITALLECLETTTGERGHWMTPGYPTIAFVRGRSEPIATVKVVGNTRASLEFADGWAIRSSLWSGDAPLRRPEELSEWLRRTIAASSE